MNRLQFLLKAQTVYSVHSPAVFSLCTDVLGARLSRAARRRLGGGKFAMTVYKLSRHFGAEARPIADGEVLIASDDPILVVRRPHADKVSEERWASLQADPQYRVSIDVYDYGVLLSDHRLHRQRFLLIV